MRLPYYIPQIKKEKKSSFTYEEITNTLFFNRPPYYTVQPLQHLTHPKFKHTSITFVIRLSYKESLLERMTNAITRLDDCQIDLTTNIILNLPYWIYYILLKEYEKVMNEWIEYYIENINDYCKNSEISQLNWNTVKLGLSVSFIKEEPTLEQKIWIKVNQVLDKKELIDYVEEIRKSLLPWFNLDLYKEWEKKKKNVRENVKYEEERRNMLKNQFNYNQEEELDIIR